MTIVNTRDSGAVEHRTECRSMAKERHCSDLVRLVARICRKVGAVRIEYQCNA